MTHEEISDVIADLDDILNREKEAVLAGDLDQVARLFEKKTQLMERLSHFERVDDAALRGLHEKAVRNQVLLEQAAAGIKKVAQRLTALRRVRTSLDTYTERGTRESVEMNSASKVEKRA